MPSIVDDSSVSFWTVAGTVLAFLAIVVPMIIYLHQRERKELAFGALSIRSFLTASDELDGRVSVTFDGFPVKDIRLVVLGVSNTGNVPILAREFDRPFTVSFGDKARVLTADVIEQQPGNLGVKVNARDQDIQFTPVLLNPGDSFATQLLIAAPEIHIYADVRVIGVASLEQLGTEAAMRRERSLGFAQGVLGSGIVAPLVLAGLFGNYVGSEGSAALVIGSLVVAGVAASFLAIDWLRNYHAAKSAQRIDYW